MQRNRTMKRLALLLALLAITVLSGCSTAPPAAKPRVLWPPPPATPKLEWILSYSSEDNFPKTDRQIAAERFLGKTEQNYFYKPTGVASRGDGVVYVADMDIGAIRVIDFNTSTSTLYTQDATVGVPFGLALNSQGSLFVVDGRGAQILEFDAQRRPVRTIGSGDLAKPAYLALDEGRGRMYVSDVIKHEVVVFDLATGARLFTFGGKGRAAGQLYGPQGIAIDSQGRIFVAEQFNTRIQVFDGDGNSLDMFGSRGDKEFAFEGPRGLAFDSEDNLYVAEARKGTILIFLPDGTPLSKLGGGNALGLFGFTLPTHIAIDRNDRIYISDGMNRRITIWQRLTPAYLADHPLDPAELQSIERRVRELQEEK